MQSIAKYLCNYSKAMTSNGKQLSIVKYSYVLVHVKVVQTNIAKYPKYLNCWISYPLLISAVLRERRRYQIGWIFGKFPKGEGSFSIQKFMLQILGTLNRAFWSWNWYKIVISGFRVCFFQQWQWWWRWRTNNDGKTINLVQAQTKWELAAQQGTLLIIIIIYDHNHLYS